MLIRLPSVVAISIFSLFGSLPVGAQADRIQSPPRILPTGEWVMVQGESPASLARLLYPGQPVVQRRFVAALAEANPMLGIDAGGDAVLAEGSTLRMPDWRRLAAGVAGEPRPARPAAAQAARRPNNDTAADRAPVPPDVPMPKVIDARTRRVGDPGLRMSTSLALAPAADEHMRAILRLEFRLLMSLGDQLSATGLLASPPVALPTEGEAAKPAIPPPVAVQPLPAVALPPVSAPVPPVSPVAEGERAAASGPVVAEPVAAPAPVKLKQSPPAASPDTAADPDLLSYYSAGAVFLLLLAGWLVRRRRQPATHEASLDYAQTVMLELPHSSMSSTPSPALAVVAAEARVEAPQVFVESPPELPKAPDMSDVNPVMELAEIMLSFGRLQSAAQTLQEYIEANPKEALQPWVKLLDIYREGNMREQFDVLAGKLHQNFNVELQQWDGSIPPTKPDASFVRATSLEELPHVVERIVSRWPHDDCQDYLRRLLRDNRNGERSGFTLPVVQEVLLLIDILATRNAVGHA